jgi:hypothetical protein
MLCYVCVACSYKSAVWLAGQSLDTPLLPVFEVFCL